MAGFQPSTNGRFWVSTEATIHANTAIDALMRITSLALEAGKARWEILCQQVASAFYYVVHQTRLPLGRRGISQLLRLDGYDYKTGDWRAEVVWDRVADRLPGVCDIPTSPRPLPARGSALVPGRGFLVAPVHGAPRRPDVSDPATMTPPARRGDPSLIIVQRWPRQRVQSLAELPQATGRLPEGKPDLIRLPLSVLESLEGAHRPPQAPGLPEPSNSVDKAAPSDVPLPSDALPPGDAAVPPEVSEEVHPAVPSAAPEDFPPPVPTEPSALSRSATAKIASGARGAESLPGEDGSSVVEPSSSGVPPAAVRTAPDGGRPF